MKKVLAAIGKALGYFAVYFTASNIVTLIVSYVTAFTFGRANAQAGIGREEGLAMLQDKINSMTGICLIIGSLLALLAFFIIEKVKKTSLAEQTDMKAVSGKQMIYTVIGAVGAMFFMNFMLSILPIPEELLGDLTSGMSKLSAYPFWQAMLANAIIVPITEEVVFRGYIYSRLKKAMPAIVAALISSAVFGICHGGIVWAIWAFCMGMLICVVRMKSGSIIPGIVIHIIMNTFATVTSYYPVLDKITTPVMYALTIAGGILVAVYIAGILTDKETSGKKAEVKITSSEA